MTAALRCTVRGCALELHREGAAWRCGAGHAFDVARRGHVNLLQPQDRRSPRPGDGAAALEARARILEAGHASALLGAIIDLLRAAALPVDAALLDVGCGDGFFLAGVAEALPVGAWGLDISVEAVERAARRLPSARFVVANADRGLPFRDACFEAALSVTSRRPEDELARVLVPRGVLLVAVPAEDDLVELREAVQGEGRRRERLEAVIAELAPHFDVEQRRHVSQRVRADAATVADLLASTYRSARTRDQRAAALPALDVTLSADLALLRRR